MAPDNLSERPAEVVRTKKILVTHWIQELIAAAHGQEIEQRRPLQILNGHVVAGPRSAAIILDAGIENGRLLGLLGAHDGALVRHYANRCNLPYVGQPQVSMHPRGVRVEVRWENRLAETDVRLTDVTQRPAGLRIRGDGYAIGWTIGRSEAGRTVVAELGDSNPHYLVAGETGSGKSVALMSLVAQLAPLVAERKVGLILLDGKGGVDYRASGMDRLANLVGPLVSDIQEARLALAWALAEMNRRMDERIDTLPPLILIVDELRVFADDPYCMDVLSHLAARGRGLRMHLVCGTQHPTNRFLGDDSSFKRSIPGRIGLRVTDVDAVRTVMGDTAYRLDYLGGSGDAYVRTVEATHRVQVAYATRELIDQLPHGAPQLEAWPSASAENASVKSARFSAEDIAHAMRVIGKHGLDVGRPRLQDERSQPWFAGGVEQPALGRKGSQQASDLLALAKSLWKLGIRAVDDEEAIPAWIEPQAAPDWWQES